MSKPPGRAGGRVPRGPAALPAARIEGAEVLVTGVRHLPAVALLLDGRLVGSAAGGAEPVRLPLPATVLAGSVDVMDPANGRSLLAAPLDVAAARPVAWLGWALEGLRIAGRLRTAAGLEAPLLVEARQDTEVFARGLTHLDADGTHVFSLPLLRLVRLDRPLTLFPVVAGQPIDAPMRVAARTVGIAGYVDRPGNRTLDGWVTRHAARERLSVELRRQGRVIATAKAVDERPDVQALGYGDGKCGFRLALPADLDRSQEQTLSVFLKGGATELVGSPVVLPAQPRYVGFFDGVEGPLVNGWVIDMHHPGTAPVVEALVDGEVVGSETARLYRGDVETAGLPTGWCGLRLTIERPLPPLFGRDLTLRVKGTDFVVPGSPRRVEQNPNIQRFLQRKDAVPPAVLQRLSRRLSHEVEQTPVSIIVPVYNTKREWLIEALNSVLNQWSAHWELILVDDASPAPHVREVLEQAKRHDPRIRVLLSPENQGIAKTVNLGLRAARGRYVLVMDHDDVLEPDAVHKLALAAQQTGADLVYADEAVTTADIDSVTSVAARPAFSYDYYLSHPYFVHPVLVRTDLAQSVGGWDESLPISADVDYVLRVLEKARGVAHVPAVLYRWRTHPGSTGHRSMGQVTETMVGCLQRHLDRQGLGATASPGLHYNNYRIDWPDDGGEVLIVIPTKDRIDLLKPCIDSIERTCAGVKYRIVVIDHQSRHKPTVAYLKQIAGRHHVMPYEGTFNYPRMNNAAVRAFGQDSRYVVFMNNDVEARDEGWLPRLRSLAARPEVGAVGPLLLYGDERVQHAGVILAFNEYADHVMKFSPAFEGTQGRAYGYNCTLTAVRDFSAVTAACLIMRMDVFEQVGGFDEAFTVAFNDTDLCLRVRKAGYKVLYDGFTVLNHHESATRVVSDGLKHPEDNARLRRLWPEFFTGGDPFYNPNLSVKGADHGLRTDAACKGRRAARMVGVGTQSADAPAARKASRVRKSAKPRRRAADKVDA